MASTEFNSVIIGGGLNGPLMALLLARRGHTVNLYEMRPDPRRESTAAGRSINLTIATRGFSALRRADLEEEVKKKLCTPLASRAVHRRSGPVSHTRYGIRDEEQLYAVSRNELTNYLLDAAAAEPGVTLHFRQRCEGLDLAAGTVDFHDTGTDARHTVRADLVIGADGAHSTVRRLMHRGRFVDYSQQFVPWRYREIGISAEAAAAAGLSPSSLHVWPRGNHMMFALPSQDGSFNGVCVLPEEGESSFAALRSAAEVESFFRSSFPDIAGFLPELARDFLAVPPSAFQTTKTSSWYYRDKAVLIGDACHSVIPFYGQGMNAGFEDCIMLDDCLAGSGSDLEAAFACYQRLRRPHTDVLADLSIANFDELRDTVLRRSVTARKDLLLTLSRLTGNRIRPLYSRIAHSSIPYADCVASARKQERLLRLCGLDVAVGALAAWRGLARLVRR